MKNIEYNAISTKYLKKPDYDIEGDDVKVDFPRLVAIYPLHREVHCVFLDQFNQPYRDKMDYLGIIENFEGGEIVSSSELLYLCLEGYGKYGHLDSPEECTNFLGYEIDGERRSWEEEIKKKLNQIKK